jgi:hypothetical protein
MSRTLEVSVTNKTLANYIWLHQTFLEIKTPLPQAQAPELDFDITTIRQKHQTDEQYINTYLPPKITAQQANCIGKLCPICLELYCKKTDIVRKLRCNHVFHSKCIDTWMSKNKDSLSCPYCRKVQYRVCD